MIVTGAGGYVGAAVAEYLHARGIPVLGIVRSAPTSADFRWLMLDLEVDSLTEACATSAPEMIVHCAASVPLAPLRPDDEANAASTRAIDAAVVDACVSFGCRLTYVSSCILYDPLDPGSKNEGSPVRATTPYAAAKLDGEIQAGALDGSVVMRIPSPIGGSSDRRTVLDRFVEQAMKAESLEVWGTGRREQDFIDVTDIAEFVALVGSNKVAGTFNVASGRPITMRGLADAVVDVVGTGSVVLGSRPDPQEGHTARYDIEAASELLGWKPRVSLRAMIERQSGRAR
jgi:UDP-glucose 4-epimerase